MSRQTAKKSPRPLELPPDRQAAEIVVTCRYCSDDRELWRIGRLTGDHDDGHYQRLPDGISSVPSWSEDGTTVFLACAKGHEIQLRMEPLLSKLDDLREQAGHRGRSIERLAV